MPFPGVKGLLFDYGDTLVAPPTLERLMGELRVRIVPLLIDVASPGELVILAERVLRKVDRLLSVPWAPTSLEEADLLVRLRSVFHEEHLRFPEGLLEDALGLESGELAEAVYEGKTVSAEARRVLRDLRRRGYLLAVVSSQRFQRAWLRGVPLLGPEEELVDAVVLSADVGYRKPHPRIYQAALEALGLAPHEVLVVGDRLLEDVRGPKACGIPWAVLTHEYRQEEDERGEADAVIRKLSDLLDLL